MVDGADFHEAESGGAEPGRPVVGRPVFEGTGVALVTLFDDAGALDAPATAELAAGLVDAGVRSVVVAGSTGEASTLDAGERVGLLVAVRDAVAGRVPVVAGTGAPTAGEAVRFTADAVEHGADAVLVLSPPGIDDPRPYYDDVAAAAGGVPVLAYHFPAISSPGIAVEYLADLPVAGLKDSSGQPDRLLDTLDTLDPVSGWVYTGSASILSYAGPLGCTGAILSLANVEPERCAEAFAGDAEAQRALAPTIRAARVDFPRGVKRLVARRWGTSERARAG